METLPLHEAATNAPSYRYRAGLHDGCEVTARDRLLVGNAQATDLTCEVTPGGGACMAASSVMAKE